MWQRMNRLQRRHFHHIHSDDVLLRVKVDKKRLGDLPTAPENIKDAVEISTEFWLANIDKLTERFNRWAATK